MAPKISQIPLQTIDGADATLGDYQGDMLLVVNVASKCGLRSWSPARTSTRCTPS